MAKAKDNAKTNSAKAKSVKRKPVKRKLTRKGGRSQAGTKPKTAKGGLSEQKRTSRSRRQPPAEPPPNAGTPTPEKSIFGPDAVSVDRATKAENALRQQLLQTLSKHNYLFPEGELKRTPEVLHRMLGSKTTTDRTKLGAARALLDLRRFDLTRVQVLLDASVGDDGDGELRVIRTPFRMPPGRKEGGDE